MAFALIYQLRNKKLWWIDAILYFSLALTLATIICYFIFWIKISYQEKALKQIKDSIAKTGTKEQLDLERQVFEYQDKINDFSGLIEEHKTLSSAFSFLEQFTLPNVVFSEIKLETKDPKIKLSGKTDDVQTLARQVSVLKEKNSFIKDIKFFIFRSGDGGKVSFSIIFPLDTEMFKQWK